MSFWGEFWMTLGGLAVVTATGTAAAIWLQDRMPRSAHSLRQQDEAKRRHTDGSECGS